MIDDLILVPRRRREEAEDVVTPLRLHLGGGEGRKLRVGLALDHDLDVVALSPFLRPGSEPGVVARYDMCPLDDGEPSCELLSAVSERACECVRGACATDRDRGGGDSCAPEERGARDAFRSGGHHGSVMTGVVVSANTASFGTEISIAPFASVLKKP